MTVYRTAGAWGAGKGSDLTAAEVDGNFYGHENRIVALEGIPAGVGIDYFTVTNNQLFVTLTDHSVQGPFDLPVLQWQFKQAWVPSFSYKANDVVTFLGAVYLVLKDHLSASTFDANATDGNGNALYGLLLINPAIPVTTISASTYTVTLDDSNTYMRLTNGGGCIITVPPDTVTAFKADTELHFRVAGGAISFTLPPTAASLVAPTGFLKSVSTFGGNVTLKKVGTSFWDMFGLLDAA